MIHAVRGPDPLQNGYLLPSLFVLLTNKTQATHTRMWQQIKVLCPYAHPSQIIMDFEKAAINSFEQNFWREVQSEGLQSDYIRMKSWQYASACCQPSLLPHPTRYPIYLAILYNNPCRMQPVWFSISEKPISGEHLPGGAVPH